MVSFLGVLSAREARRKKTPSDSGVFFAKNCLDEALGGARRWSLRHLFDDVWVQGGGLGVEEGIEESPPPLEDGILTPEEHAVLVCNKLLSPSLSPAQAH